MTKVYVYAACDIAYSSYYIAGLQQLYGKRNIRYSFSQFPAFAQNTLAIKIIDNKIIKKIAIDFVDRDDYAAELLAWCDVYGKINLNKLTLPPIHREKIVAIGPGFGIRLFNKVGFVMTALQNYLKAKQVIKWKKQHFSNYLSQYHYRLPLSYYDREPAQRNYLFFLSTIWKKEPSTNRFRANYIESAKELPDTIFEGGFVPRIKNDVPGFEHITIAKRVDFKQYLKNIKKSFAVFNTPAVLDCHGWKLGEYLLMGKAIISTPLTRELPAPLEHATHIHITDGSKEEITEALQKIKEDSVYRRRLEENAFTYFQQHVHPVQVMKNLIGRIL